MSGKGDQRGAKKGTKGNVPHELNEVAAAIIEQLAGYGLPQSCMSDFLTWCKEADIGVDLGDQGYSVDTLQRHYRDALNRGKVPSKEMLMGRMYAMAMMENLPQGLSTDKAYQIAADKLEKLLNIQHGIMAHQSHRHAGPNGGPIPIALLSVLDEEELEWFERISAKLEAAAAEQ